MRQDRDKNFGRYLSDANKKQKGPRRHHRNRTTKNNKSLTQRRHPKKGKSGTGSKFSSISANARIFKQIIVNAKNNIFLQKKNKSPSVN